MSHLLALLRRNHARHPLPNLGPKPTPSRIANYLSPPNSPFLRPTPSRFYSSNHHYGASTASSNLNTLYALMGINMAVFGYGAYAQAQAQSGFQAPLINFMRNMTCNLTDVLHNGAYQTLITSTFTHLNLVHLGANMFTAYYLGSMLCYAPVITPVRLMVLALGAGATGSVGYLTQRYLTVGPSGVDYMRGLGFSGALMGITSVAACLNPTATIMIYGIVPLPLWATVLGYAAYDGYYLNDSNSRIGHSGHLGGLAFGIAYYFLRLRGLRV